MSSNVFVTPRAVSTIGRGRIDHNSSLQALLQSFYSSVPPVTASVDLEGELGLKNGIVWRQGGTDAQDGRLFVYDTNSASHPLYPGFTREGIAYISQNTFSEANSALSANKFQAGEIVRVINENKLYLVSQAGTSLLPVGAEGSTAADIWKTDNAYVYYLEGLNVGIGVANPSYTLTVNGNVFASQDFVTPSDLSLKFNIQPIVEGIDVINAITPVTYNKYTDNELHSGVIAQDIEKIIPHIVRTSEEGIKHVVYDELIPYLISAVKVLTLRVQELEDGISK
jgi:hypothetical protein